MVVGGGGVGGSVIAEGGTIGTTVCPNKLSAPLSLLPPAPSVGTARAGVPAPHAAARPAAGLRRPGRRDAGATAAAVCEGRRVAELGAGARRRLCQRLAGFEPPPAHNHHLMPCAPLTPLSPLLAPSRRCCLTCCTAGSSARVTSSASSGCTATSALPSPPTPRTGSSSRRAAAAAAMGRAARVFAA